MVNDMTISFGIFVFFMIITAFIPFYNEAFNQSVSETNIDGLIEDDADISFLQSLGIVFFWSFGVLPLWFEIIIFLPLRLLLGFILIRNLVPFIGGSG